MTQRGGGPSSGGSSLQAASPRVVAELAKAYGLPLQGRLGQNFLIDANVADRIVDALEPTADDVVLEIGPGLGALTERLLERVGYVVAVEIDPVLVAALQDRFGERAGLHIQQGDARRLPLAELLASASSKEGGARRKAIGNLPYYATSPLLFKLLEVAPPLDTIVVMVQREVAHRMIAPPGGKDYGVLSVNVQYRAAAELMFHVPPSVFIPRPDVHSSVVRLRPKRHGARIPVDPAHVEHVVRAAFSQRRKTVQNSLRSAYTPDVVAAALTQADIDGARRAETLSVDEFVRLASVLPRAV